MAWKMVSDVCEKKWILEGGKVWILKDIGK
jgi:hypothetical protein